METSQHKIGAVLFYILTEFFFTTEMEIVINTRIILAPKCFHVKLDNLLAILPTIPDIQITHLHFGRYIQKRWTWKMSTCILRILNTKACTWKHLKSGQHLKNTSITILQHTKWEKQMSVCCMTWPYFSFISGTVVEHHLSPEVAVKLSTRLYNYCFCHFTAQQTVKQ